MTSEEFTRNLTLRHPSKRDSAAAILGDIKGFLERIDKRRIEELWEYYKGNYEKDSIPRVAYFVKAAKELGIGANRRSPWAYRCQACGTIYSKRSTGCPKCRKLTEVVVVEYSAVPKGAVRVHASCWQCGLYSEYAIGPVCRSYGKKPDNPEVCKDCECRRCCQEERLFREDPDHYQKLLDAGKLFIPTDAKQNKKAG